MLKNLYITNYALIEELNIEWKNGFTVITGETGAGKSIILGALSLVLGRRADHDLLKISEKKCVVEAVFITKKTELQNLFLINEIEILPEIILRREILPSGTSRNFINDTPVNLGLLKQTAELLIDIHSQHENLQINNGQYQLMVIDAAAENKILLQEYQVLFNDYTSHLKKFEQLKGEVSKAKADYDYYKFQFEQISSANLQPDEQAQLESEQEVLLHAAEIGSALYDSENALDQDGGGVLSSLKYISQRLNSVAGYHEVSGEISQRIESALIELKDIHSQISSVVDDVTVNPTRLEEVQQRLDVIYSLQKKHNVNSVEALIRLADDFEQHLVLSDNFEIELEALTKKTESLKQDIDKSALTLSDRRKSKFNYLKRFIEDNLKNLGMPHATFDLYWEKKAESTINGIDHVDFLFSANPKIPVERINKVASGGELSRLMMVIKLLLAKTSEIPTLIFDEIDNGVSGEIADKMAQMMMALSSNNQVVAITHLPQIAAKGYQHFLVYKQLSKDIALTGIKELNNEDRIHEIARMLSGSELTAAAILNAKELLSVK